MAATIAQKPTPTTDRAVGGVGSRLTALASGGSAITVLGAALAAATVPLGVSGLRAMRLNVAGLYAHPYLPLYGIVFAVAVLPRIREVPSRIVGACLLFFSCYLIASMRGGVLMSEGLKIGASVLTFFTVLVAIRTRGDLRLFACALSIAAAIMGIDGLLRGGGELQGINPFDEMGNKNAYSLYALPALLLAGYVVLDRSASKAQRIVLIGCSLISTFSIFASANRSGWTGALLIGLMLFRLKGRRLRSVLLVAIIAVAAYWFLGRYGAKHMLEHRFDQTFEGFSSDKFRRELFWTALKIGLEAPLLGVGRLGLQLELQRRLYIEIPLDPHNVVAFLFGAGGLVTMSAFLYLGWVLWRRPPGLGRRASNPAAEDAHRIVRMMLLLWLVRGQFTHEILYAPAFCMGVGAVLKLSILNGGWSPARKKAQREKPLVPAPRPA